MNTYDIFLYLYLGMIFFFFYFICGSSFQIEEPEQEWERNTSGLSTTSSNCITYTNNDLTYADDRLYEEETYPYAQTQTHNQTSRVYNIVYIENFNYNRSSSSDHTRLTELLDKSLQDKEPIMIVDSRDEDLPLSDVIKRAKAHSSR